MGYNAGLVQKNGTEIYVIKWKNIKICRNKKRSKPVKARSVMYEILRCLAFLEFLSHINFPNKVGKSTALAQSPQYFPYWKNHTKRIYHLSGRSLSFEANCDNKKRRVTKRRLDKRMIIKALQAILITYDVISLLDIRR
ncbi:MAG: hypothetical protein FWC07_10160 [Defluviitaleaceae bacterium]|nr:hypothetical protein [Defluviitaleaceae bacterium]